MFRCFIPITIKYFKPSSLPYNKFLYTAPVEPIDTSIVAVLE